MTKICTRLLALLVFLPMLGFGQVAYQLSPVPHQQFLDNNGKPLAGGFIYSFSAGSSTPLATYKDNIGTANTNPIVLDAGGFATIYLGQNSYKFCVQNSSAVQQWCQDNVQNISQVLLTTANVWTAAQTFNGLINFLGGTSDTTAADGNFFYRTDLHRGRWYDSGAAAWHSIVGADSTDTLSNKSLTSPTSTGTDSGTETLVNKTLTSPVINTPTIASPMVSGHLNQAAGSSFAGTCAMAAGTSCTITILGAFGSSPVCIPAVQGTTAIAGACSVSGTTVTITAASSNSQIWGAVLIGNPN